MSGVKLTPRQKMINMMYLVLTAILALNVSSEVLNAFKTVNDGISNSNQSMQSKNADTYSILTKQYERDSIKAKDAFVKAQRAKELSGKLYGLLDQYKAQMVKEAGGIDPLNGKIKRDDDIDIPTRLFVENNGKTGKELKLQIDSTRLELLNLLNAEDRAELEKSMPLKTDGAGEGKTWEYAKFNQIPVVAAVTLLSKYQNDLLSAESHVIETLFGAIDRDKHKVDKMAAMVMSPSSFVLQGEPYKADVMVAAYSSTQHPDIFIGQLNPGIKKNEHGDYAMIACNNETPPLSGAQKIEVDGGTGKILMPGNAIGNKKYAGVVRVKAPGEGYEFYPFDGEYQVAPKVVVVSPKLMNVMYLGLQNDIDVSVPGVAASDITASIDAGSLTKNSDGSYNAKPVSTGLAKVIVKAKVNGRDIVMGEQQFRVKRVPDPISTVDGRLELQGGKITLARMKSTRALIALMQNFDYPVRFEIVSYKMSYKSHKEDNISQPIDVTGPVYNAQVRDIIDHRIQPGDNVLFDDITVKGPAGDKRKLSSLVFVVTR